MGDNKAKNGKPAGTNPAQGQKAPAKDAATNVAGTKAPAGKK